jgi:hypothetical protein
MTVLDYITAPNQQGTGAIMIMLVILWFIYSIRKKRDDEP